MQVEHVVVEQLRAEHKKHIANINGKKFLVTTTYNVYSFGLCANYDAEYDSVRDKKVMIKRIIPVGSRFIKTMNTVYKKHIRNGELWFAATSNDHAIAILTKFDRVVRKFAHNQFKKLMPNAIVVTPYSEEFEPGLIDPKLNAKLDKQLAAMGSA